MSTAQTADAVLKRPDWLGRTLPPLSGEPAAVKLADKKVQQQGPSGIQRQQR